MRTLGVMTARADASYRRSNEVVVRSDRGLEIGQVLCEASDDALSHLDKPAVGSIVRLVSEDDVAGIDDIDGARQRNLDICERHIRALSLDMKLVEIEQLFGGEKLIVYYVAEERVDFRELVRALAADFKTRIEMRQIGVRDEAKLLADYGDCGKPVCCNTHLSAMPPVSMKMAKLQKATLDPTKISGRCGRLKCCLRYEYDNYVDTQRQLPKVGARVVTRNGTMKVLNQQILAEQLLVETEDHRRTVIDASEVLSVLPRSATPPESPKPEAADPADRNSSRRPRRNRRSNDSKSKSDTKPGQQGNSQQGPASRPTSEPPESQRPSAEARRSDSAQRDVSGSSESKPTDGKKKRPRRNRNRRRKPKPKSDES